MTQPRIEPQSTEQLAHTTSKTLVKQLFSEVLVIKKNLVNTLVPYEECIIVL